MQEGVKKTKVDNNYYVYLHRKKSDGTVFYVGKGKGKRAWDFRGRSQLWNNYKNKYDITVEIVQTNLSEWYAFELECDLILLYGRVDNDTGILCNHTDGGKGTFSKVYSQKERDAISNRVSGDKSPRADHTVYNLTNYNTTEKFTGTRLEFFSHYKVKIDGLFKTNPFCLVKGWYISDKFTKQDIDVWLKPRTLLNSTHTDKTIYTFINIVDELSFIGNRTEFKLKFNFDPLTLFHGVIISNKWLLSTSLIKYTYKAIIACKYLNNEKDKNIYTFKNIKTNEIFEGTRREHILKYNVSNRDLFKKQKTSHGWMLVK